MDSPLQFNVEVEIFGVILFLIHNYGFNEGFPISLDKDK